jgi:hypothetical protein
MDRGKTGLLWLFLVLSQSAWASVFVVWGNSPVPAASSLGVSNLVFDWKSRPSASLLHQARQQGYRVYVEVALGQAGTAAEEGQRAEWTGLILDIPESAGTVTRSVSGLRSKYPKMQFLVLDLAGKQPQMRGSLVMMNDSVLEVSSPTMQPWIDTNLAPIKIEHRKRQSELPLYTFSWSNSDRGQQAAVTASDYSLAVAEAGAFHAHLLLRLDERLQKSLSNKDDGAWALWSQVRSTAEFYSKRTEDSEAAANVAVVLDRLETGDEVLNLLARHNIPFQVFLPGDMTAARLNKFDVVIFFANPDKAAADQLSGFARRGKTVVLVNAQGSKPWHSLQSARVNEDTVLYLIGTGKVLELSGQVTDPEVFAQDIRRLLGKRDSLLTVWTGLTTIAVPYQRQSGRLTTIELVNYAGDPIRVQVQVKGAFRSIRYESPEHGCCESLAPVVHDSFTDFVIPELRIAGRVHLDNEQGRWK